MITLPELPDTLDLTKQLLKNCSHNLRDRAKRRAIQVLTLTLVADGGSGKPQAIEELALCAISIIDLIEEGRCTITFIERDGE